MMRLAACALLMLSFFLHGQSLKVEVFLYEEDGGKALPHGRVVLGNHWQYTRANGGSDFKVPAGEYSLSAGYMGFHDTTFTLQVSRDTSLYIFLRERDVLLTEVEVRDMHLSGARAVLQEQVMRSTVSPADVQAKPLIGGEPDILKPLQAVPGVQAGLPGSADIYVRGSDQYQNAILLDGFPVYNLSHGLGYASAIPVAGVERLDFYKQGFPVELGGATASFTDVKMQRGSTKKWSGEFAGGIGSLRTQLSMPIKKDVSALQLGGRFSTLGLAMEALQLFDVQFEGLFGFHDMQGKYHHRIGSRDVLEVLGYYSADQIRSGAANREVDNGINTGNFLSGITHYHTGKDNSLITQKLHFSNYFFHQQKAYEQNGTQGFNAGDAFTYDFRVRNFGYKTHWQKQVSSSGRLMLGGEFNAHLFYMPEAGGSGAAEIHYDEPGGGLRAVYNPLLFGGHQWSVTDALTVNTGLRISGFSYTGENLEIKLLPRIALEYQPVESWAFFSSYDHTAQAHHRFRNTFFGSALDFPLPVTEQLPVEESRQLAAGAVYSPGRLSLSLQAYYRDLINAVDRDYSQATLVYGTEGGQTPPANPLSGLLPVDGTAYGVEAAADYHWSIFKLQGAYTWSQATRQSPVLNYGEPYHFEYNHEHHFTFSGVVRFKRNAIDKITEIGLSYTYGSGNYTQFPVQYRATPSLPGYSSYSANNQWNLNNLFVHRRNNVRLPPLQHLDVVINFIAQKEKGVRIFSISAFNLLFSPLVTQYVYEKERGGRSSEKEQIRGQGPFVFVPAITYTYKF